MTRLRVHNRSDVMSKTSKVVKRAQAARVIAGISKHFAGKTGIDVGGKRYTPKQLVGLFQSHIDAIEEVDAAHAAGAVAVAKERKAALRVRDATRYLKMVVEVEFGPDAVAWDDFGWELPKKPGPKTVEAKLEGARKVRETRKLRNTMGKRQRKKIRGW
jgi:hypothetical protein